MLKVGLGGGSRWARATLGFASVLTIAACGANSSGAEQPQSEGGADAALPACVDLWGGSVEAPAHAALICRASGFPFVMFAGATSDACAGSRLGECQHPRLSATTADLFQPATGKLCLAGTVAPADGWTKIVPAFSTFNTERTKILKVFDAHAMGITQVAFTIDSPPSGGVTIDAAVVTAIDCPSSPGDCFTYGGDRGLFGPAPDDA
jgi:hypothetical protein